MPRRAYKSVLCLISPLFFCCTDLSSDTTLVVMSDSIRPKTVSDTSRRGTRYTLERKSLEPRSTSGDLPTVCETPSFGVTDVLICHTQAYAYGGRDLSLVVLMKIREQRMRTYLWPITPWGWPPVPVVLVSLETFLRFFWGRFIDLNKTHFLVFCKEVKKMMNELS